MTSKMEMHTQESDEKKCLMFEYESSFRVLYSFLLRLLLIILTCVFNLSKVETKRNKTVVIYFLSKEK